MGEVGFILSGVSDSIIVYLGFETAPALLAGLIINLSINIPVINEVTIAAIVAAQIFQSHFINRVAATKAFNVPIDPCAKFVVFEVLNISTIPRAANA